MSIQHHCHYCTNRFSKCMPQRPTGINLSWIPRKSFAKRETCCAFIFDHKYWYCGFLRHYKQLVDSLCLFRITGHYFALLYSSLLGLYKGFTHGKWKAYHAFWSFLLFLFCTHTHTHTHCYSCTFKMTKRIPSQPENNPSTSKEKYETPMTRHGETFTRRKP